MRIIRNFILFWYHFVIGDDWRIAVGVIVGLLITAYLVHIVHINIWWFLPLIIVTMFSLSLWFASRHK